jgi:hypothetical protein
MRFPLFRRSVVPVPVDPAAVPEPPPPSRFQRFRFLSIRLRRAAPVAPVPLVAPVAPAEPPPPVARRALTPVARAWKRVRGGLDAIDGAFAALAIPFGVRIADPRRRYGVLLGVFAAVYVVGSLPVPWLPLAALAFGYVGVLAVGRAWVRNEQERTAISRKLQDGDPDAMPDLRGTALVSALQLFVLFPLIYQQAEWHFGLFKESGSANFFDWVWFSIDKTYLKSLPDWSVLYGIHISAIDFGSPWGRHLVLLSRLTFDYILIQGVLRLLAIRATVNEAVAAVKADPDMAVRLGRRAVGALAEKLHDPDRAVRGAAANALTQLGRLEAIHAAAEHHAAQA